MRLLQPFRFGIAQVLSVPGGMCAPSLREHRHPLASPPTPNGICSLQRMPCPRRSPVHPALSGMVFLCEFLPDLAVLPSACGGMCQTEHAVYRRMPPKSRRYLLRESSPIPCGSAQPHRKRSCPPHARRSRAAIPGAPDPSARRSRSHSSAPHLLVPRSTHPAQYPHACLLRAPLPVPPRHITIPVFQIIRSAAPGTRQRPRHNRQPRQQHAAGADMISTIQNRKQLV